MSARSWSSLRMRWPAAVSLKSFISMTPCSRGFSRETARTAIGEQLAESGGLLLQIRPARAGRDIEAYEFVVLVNEAGAGAEAIEVVLVNVGEALEEDERKDVVLELGASMGPRMMQAASQSQDSRAEMSSTAAGMRGGIIAWGVEISA